MVSTKSDYIHTDIQLQSELGLNLGLNMPTKQKTQTTNCKFCNHIETRKFKRYRKKTQSNQFKTKRNRSEFVATSILFQLQCETDKNDFLAIRWANRSKMLCLLSQSEKEIKFDRPFNICGYFASFISAAIQSFVFDIQIWIQIFQLETRLNIKRQEYEWYSV